MAKWPNRLTMGGQIASDVAMGKSLANQQCDHPRSSNIENTRGTLVFPILELRGCPSCLIASCPSSIEYLAITHFVLRGPFPRARLCARATLPRAQLFCAEDSPARNVPCVRLFERATLSARSFSARANLSARAAFLVPSCASTLRADYRAWVCPARN